MILKRDVLSGTNIYLVKSEIRFGVTMVGTISPEISFEETYGFFDADMTYSGTLMLNGKASV